MQQKNITCPFCGLACDDLTISFRHNQLAIERGQCNLNRKAFSRPRQVDTDTAMLRGKPSPLETATDKAANLLNSAASPLIGGLVTDVNGARAAMALADASGAVIDHQDSNAVFRNTRVLQDSGWMTTTLTEVRNRADLVIVIGTAILDDHPRFFERILQPKPRFLKKDRQLVLLGPWDRRKSPAR